MHTITLFAPKGGTGRTTATMALASGFLAMGKRVLVVDATDQAMPKPRCPYPTTLRKWHGAMSVCGIDSHRLGLTEVHTPAQVSDELALAAARGADIALIDTQTMPQAPQIEALTRSDLILTPATGPFEARRAIRGIATYLAEPKNLLGLVTGCRNGADEVADTRVAFGDTPVLRTALPWAEAIADLTLHGDIPDFVAALTCGEDKPGYARFREAQSAWAAALALTCEVQWALDGLRLAPHRPDDAHDSGDWEISA